jgi:hypothetical protein
MRFIYRVSILAVALSMSLLWATPVSARQLGDRSFQGLFGAGGYDPNVRHSLEFTASVVEAYDDDIPEGLGPGFGANAEDHFVVGGYSTMFTGQANYRLRRSGWTIGASAYSVMRYFSGIDEFRSTSHIGSAGFFTNLTKSTELSVNQTVSYSPSYLYSLFPTAPPIDPGELPPGGTDYAVIDSESIAYSTSVMLNQRLSSRNRVTVNAEYDYTDFSDDQTAFRDLRSSGIGAGYMRNLSKRVGLTANYEYRIGDYNFQQASNTTEHGVEFGMEWTKPISATRSAVLAFSVGARTIYGPKPLFVVPVSEDPDAVPVFENGRTNLMAGELLIGYQFGRSWSANGTVRRGIDYVAGFPQPVLTGGFTAGVSGFLSRRVEVEGSGGYAKGDTAIYRGRPFDSYTAEARVRFGLVKSLAAYVEYIYYYYLFAESDLVIQEPTGLISELPSGLERNGIRVGLSVWMPAFRK